MSFTGIAALILGLVLGYRDFVVTDNPLFFPMAATVLAAGACLVAVTRMEGCAWKKILLAAYCALAVFSIWASFGTLLLLEPVLLLILAASALRGVPGSPLSRRGFGEGDLLSTFLYSGFLPFMASYFLCGHDLMVPVQDAGSQFTHFAFNWMLLLPACLLGALALGERALKGKLGKKRA